MAVAQIVKGDLKVEGSISATGNNTPSAGSVSNTHLSSTANIERGKLEQSTNFIYNVPLTDLRVWDAIQTNLPGTAATDDLALVGGTFATGSPQIQAGDLKAAGATTRYARFIVALPAEYDDGESVTLRCYAGMETTIADVSATLDAQVYESDGAGGISADLCTTSATSINSTTFANVDFAITSTGLVAGDVLDIRLAIACNDAATATAVTPAIGKIQLLCDVRG